MKVVILAGGRGMRLAEETSERPKSLVEVGGVPMLRHVMDLYAGQGLRDFVLALGYRAEQIRDFAESLPADWNVEAVDTGIDTQTGGRLRRLAPQIGDERFLMTYADAVSNIDLHALLAFHERHGRLATVTAAHPPARFGRLSLDGERVVAFTEKPRDEDWVNGGFFVLEAGVLDHIEDDTTVWERGPMEQLAARGELMAFRHPGFWQCLDTIHDLRRLEELWRCGAPWLLKERPHLQAQEIQQ